MTISDTLRSGFEAMGLMSAGKGRELADALLADAEGERLRIRTAQAAERATISAELLARAIALEPRQLDAAALIERKRRELDEAIEAAHDVVRGESQVRFTLDHRHSQLERALVISASPLLETCERELRDQLRATYEQRDNVLLRQVDGRDHLVWSNSDDVVRRAEAIKTAIDFVHTLAFEPLTEDELEARLARLRDNLPLVAMRPAKYQGFGAEA